MDTDENKRYYKWGLLFHDDNTKNILVRNPNGRFTLNYNNRWAYFFDGVILMIFIGKMLALFGVIH